MGLTQKELAQATKVSNRTIKDLELGMGNPTLDTLEKLASVLDCTVADLLAETPDVHIAMIVRTRLVPALRKMLALLDEA